MRSRSAARLSPVSMASTVPPSPDPRLAGRRHASPPAACPQSSGAPWRSLDRRYRAYSRTMCRIPAEDLVAAAPAHVLRHGERRRKRPVDARGRDALGRDGSDALHEFRIARRAESDVVRKNPRRPACCCDLCTRRCRTSAGSRRGPGGGRQCGRVEARASSSHCCGVARSSPFGPPLPPARIEPSG